MVKEKKENPLIIKPCAKRNNNKGQSNFIFTQAEYNGTIYDLNYKDE